MLFSAIMRCHYEILGVSRDVDGAILKTAYRKCALKWHPDKNLDNVDKAKEEFQLVQQAYEVLSDPQERAWYDNHREAILKGGFGDSYKDDSLNLFPYFSASCYQGFGDDEKGFYAVYREVFKKIYAEDWDVDDEDNPKVPEFGCSDSSYDEVVHPFYAYWENYCTTKSFVWLDEFDIREAPNRRVMRLMEKENKKARDKARKERNEEIRTLVKFVRKRDKRLEKQRKYLEEKAAENAKKGQLNRLRQLEERNRQIRESKEAEWSKMENIEKELKEMEANLASEFGESCSQEGSVSGDEDGAVLDQLHCFVCSKNFKTEKSFANHENSKRHKDNYSAFKEALSSKVSSSDDDELNEGDLDAHELPNVNDLDEDNLETNGDLPKKKSKSKKVLKPTEEFINIVASDDSDNDFAKSNSKKQKKKNTKRKTNNLPATSNGVKCGDVESPVIDLIAEDDVKSDDDSFNTRKKSEKKQKGKNHEKKNKAVEDFTKDINHTCVTCEMTFSSKNKLFQHLKTSGHSKYIPKTILQSKEKVPVKLKKEEYKN